MSSTEFKKGQKVKYSTTRGRAGTGVIKAVTSTVKGAWYSIENPDGSISKARAGQMQAI